MVELERSCESSHFALAPSLLPVTAMMRSALLLALVACTSGDAPQTNTIGRQCSAMLTLSGSFAQTSARPVGSDGMPITGCWPIGTWTFSATMGENDCSDTPTLLPHYVMTGTEGTDMNGDYTESFAYTTDPSAMTIVKVTEAGNGQCEGELDIFSANGLDEWNFSPFLNPDNSINGQGLYSEYTTNQWVGTGSD
jgi:hypothetical protein